MSKGKHQGLLLLGLALAFVATASVRAADNETQVTSDRSKNPITGTVTDTTTYKKKRKHRNGKTSERNVTKTTKYKTDGSVQTETDVNTKSKTE